MRILYITQWFEPEPIVKGIVFAKAFAERGHQVEVVPKVAGQHVVGGQLNAKGEAIG